MLTVLVCALTLVLAWLALVALAIRQEYLLVLQLPRVTMFFERRGEERYALVSPVLIPLVTLRFAGYLLSLTPAAARQVLSRAGQHLPYPVSSKA